MTIEEHLLNVKTNIKTALEKSGKRQRVEIVAATKTQTFDTIIAAYGCGITNIGENRVQEAEKKFLSFSEMPKIKRRFIGHLQTNKVNKCLEIFDTVDSIDTIKLAKKISNRISLPNKKIESLIEITTSGDTNNNGFKPTHIEAILESLKIENLNIVGLMTLGPVSQNEQETRKAFSLLANIKKTINEKIGTNKIHVLSMGMSGDYSIAVEEGSNMVRLGTTLFGSRK